MERISTDILVEIVIRCSPCDITPFACVCKKFAQILRDFKARIWCGLAERIPRIFPKQFDYLKNPDFAPADYWKELFLEASFANNCRGEPEKLYSTRISWEKGVGELNGNNFIHLREKSFWISRIMFIPRMIPAEVSTFYFDILFNDIVVATASFHGQTRINIAGISQNAFVFETKKLFYLNFDIFYNLYKLTYKCYYKSLDGKMKQIILSNWFGIASANFLVYSDENYFISSYGKFSSSFIDGERILRIRRQPYCLQILDAENRRKYFRAIMTHILRANSIARKQFAIYR